MSASQSFDVLESGAEVDTIAVFRRLKPWHYAAFLAHLAQGVAALTLSLCSQSACDRYRTFKIPQVHNRLSWNDDPTLTRYVTDDLYAFPFVAVMSSIAFISALAHLRYATVPSSTPLPQNPRRWVEYAASSSVMMAGILMLCGVWDVTMLSVLSLCNALMCFTGITAERAWASGNKDPSAFFIGTALGLIPWGVILGNLHHGSPPAFVYVVVYGYLALFCLFPMVFSWQWEGRSAALATERAERAEIYFLVLSFSAKAILLWGVIGGVGQPNRYADAP